MLSIRGSDALKAVVLAFKAADRDLRSDINKATRSTMSPAWTSAVQHEAARRTDGLVIAKGARIVAGNPPVAVAATSRRPLKGGLVPSERWQPFEFGANRAKVTTYTRRSAKGGTHKVTRHTARQLPRITPKGRVAYQAFAEIAPRMAALWVQIVVKKYSDAAETRS